MNSSKVPAGLALLVDGRCGMNCTYCYARRFPREVMSDEVLAAAIEHLKRSGKRTFVSIIGGEPFFDVDRCLRVLDTLRRELPEASLAITTAAPLEITAGWRTDVADELVDLNVHVTVSVDGPDDVHDAQRAGPFGPHQAMHDSAMRFVWALSKRGYRKMQIRSTIDPNVHAVPPVFDVVRYNTQTCAAMGVPSFAVEIAALRAPEGRIYTCKFEPALDEAVRWYAENPLGVRWHEVVMAWARRRKRYLSPRPSCGQACTMLAVAPDGGLWPCHRLPGERPLGTVFDGVDMAELRRWWGRVLASRVDCGRCEIWSQCRGGCPAEDAGGAPNPTTCAWRRALVKAALTHLPRAVSYGRDGENEERGDGRERGDSTAR